MEWKFEGKKVMKTQFFAVNRDDIPHSLILNLRAQLLKSSHRSQFQDTHNHSGSPLELLSQYTEEIKDSNSASLSCTDGQSF